MRPHGSPWMTHEEPLAVDVVEAVECHAGLGTRLGELPREHLEAWLQVRRDLSVAAWKAGRVASVGSELIGRRSENEELALLATWADGFALQILRVVGEKVGADFLRDVFVRKNAFALIVRWNERTGQCLAIGFRSKEALEERARIFDRHGPALRRGCGRWTRAGRGT